MNWVTCFRPLCLSELTDHAVGQPIYLAAGGVETFFVVAPVLLGEHVLLGVLEHEEAQLVHLVCPRLVVRELVMIMIRLAGMINVWQ